MSDARDTLPAYINTFDRSKGFQRLVFHYDRFLGGHELNVLGDMEADRVKQIGDALMRDGKITAGGAIILGDVTGTKGQPGSSVVVQLADAKVYIRGAVHDIKARSFSVPAFGTVVVGVRLRTFVATYEDDPTLKGQAPSTRAEGEPGASALVSLGNWGFDGDGEDGDFFPVYTIIDGVVIEDPPTDNMDAWSQLLARYDREAHASYVVEGFRVQPIGYSAGTQAFSISEGTVNVYGYKRSRSNASRLTITEEPDIHSIDNEPHAVMSGVQTISVRFGPIKSVDEVVVTKEKTVTLAHGAFSGAIDALPDETAIQIMEVKQGATTYVVTTDYKLTGSSVDWSPAGAEPAPGSTYTVKYRYISTAAPSNVTEYTFQINGAADNTIAYVKYQMKLPRYDAIVVDKEGVISYMKGLSSLYAAQPLSVSSSLLKLADIKNVWTHTPEVTQVGTVRLPFFQLRELEKMVGDLYVLVAEERLQRDVSSREPTSKRGVFVDPFIDDDLRDEGIAQTGALINNMLQLAITPTTQYASIPQQTLDFTDEIIVQQQKLTGSMKINPYMAFSPLLAQATLDPALDMWALEETQYTSRETSRIVAWDHDAPPYSVVTQSTSVTDMRVEAIETIRQRSVGFNLKGFGPLEYLVEVLFDGIDVTPSV